MITAKQCQDGEHEWSRFANSDHSGEWIEFECRCCGVITEDTLPYSNDLSGISTRALNVMEEDDGF